MFCVALEISLGVGGTAINYQKNVQHGVSDQFCWPAMLDGVYTNLE